MLLRYEVCIEIYNYVITIALTIEVTMVFCGYTGKWWWQSKLQYYNWDFSDRPVGFDGKP